MSRRIVVRRGVSHSLLADEAKPTRALRIALKAVGGKFVKQEPPASWSHPPQMTTTHRLPGGGVSIGMEHCLVVYGIYYDYDMMTMQHLLGISYLIVPDGQISFVSPGVPLLQSSIAVAREIIEDANLRNHRLLGRHDVGSLVDVFMQPVGLLLQLIFRERGAGVSITDLHFDRRIDQGVSGDGAAVIQAIRICLEIAARRGFPSAA